MKNKEKLQRIQDIQELLKTNGYIQSRRSTKAWIKEIEGHRKRFVFNPNALRLEREVNYFNGGKAWIRYRSGYYKNLSIITKENGLPVISGMTR